jgi:uncharacterized protein YkwD
MSVIRLRGSLLGLGLTALTALSGLAACGQPLDEELPQNEALPGAPEGIIFLDPDGTLPPGFEIQALTATEQASMLSAVNATRTKGTSCGGVAKPKAAALISNAKLIQAAEAHAKDMADKNYFSHTGKDGSNPGVRITRTGYSWSTYGENIAAGYPTVADAVKGWYASSGHCSNFMNGAFTQVGFGKATNAASTYKTYWVAVLAKPR